MAFSNTYTLGKSAANGVGGQVLNFLINQGGKSVKSLKQPAMDMIRGATTGALPYGISSDLDRYAGRYATVRNGQLLSSPSIGHTVGNAVGYGVTHQLAANLDAINKLKGAAPAAVSAVQNADAAAANPHPLPTTGLMDSIRSGWNGLSTGSKVGLGVGIPTLAGILAMTAMTNKNDNLQTDDE